jgi:hypothetical protein
MVADKCRAYHRHENSNSLDRADLYSPSTPRSLDGAKQRLRENRKYPDPEPATGVVDRSVVVTHPADQCVAITRLKLRT